MAKEYLSANPPYVIVVKGDTLSAIALKYGDIIPSSKDELYGSGGWLESLVTINDITNPDRIVVGQKILLSGPSIAKKNTTSKPVIKAFGLQSNTDRTIYATWTWNKSNTENYKLRWDYDTGDGVWFEGSKDTTTTSKQATYSAPNNAIRVRFKVLPVSKKRKVNGKETAYWTASWSNVSTYQFAAEPPGVPSLSSDDITIDENNQLKISMIDIDTSEDGINGNTIQFQIYRDSKTLVNSAKVKVATASGGLKTVTYTYKVQPGYTYSVRCRAIRGNLNGKWSDLVENLVSMPAVPRITDCYALSSTDNSIYLKWTNIKSASGYEIEYVYPETEIPLKKGQTYFDVEGVPNGNATTGEGIIHTTFTGLTAGQRYYFRVRAKCGDKYSEWSKIEDTLIGTTPGAPTTWSSATSVTCGEPLTLYWNSNSEDGSAPIRSRIEFKYTVLDSNGVPQTDTYIHTIPHEGSEIKQEDDEGTSLIGTVKEWITSFSGGASSDVDEEDPSKTVYRYEIETTNFNEGAQIEWRVKTQGAGDDASNEEINWGPYSTSRECNIYDIPELGFNVEGNVSESENEDLDFICEALPIVLKAELSSSLQNVIGYHVSVISKESHDSIDDVGNVKMVNSGEEIYGHYYDVSSNSLEQELSAGELTLENSVLYTITCTTSLDSGLSVSQTKKFRVMWDDDLFEPDAEVSIDYDNLTASIRPYCADTDDEGNPVYTEGVLLSVYRREFDGSFTELMKDVPNADGVFVTDPHPALDYARYRIVARSEATGGVSYYDMPGIPVDEPAIVLQWDEEWTNFNIAGENLTEQDIANELSEGVWSGSLLKLPYNVDISDTNSRDVEMVNYIGRRNPVSYYGTQIGQTATWSVEIPANDKETLYTLRRLAIWMGDVYVREPSGSGYWASVSVSFDQTHCAVTIPVTLNITRVEGGM